MFHLSEDWFLPPHTLLPALSELGVVGQTTVLVFGGAVAHVQQTIALLLLGRCKHITCILGRTLTLNAKYHRESLVSLLDVFIRDRLCMEWCAIISNRTLVQSLTDNNRIIIILFSKEKILENSKRLNTECKHLGVRFFVVCAVLPLVYSVGIYVVFFTVL